MRGDAAGAFVGALATLPQAVAYGLIAVSPLGAAWAPFGIAASVGAAIVFCILSGAVTSNRFLISGPRAVTALVVATAIEAALSRGHGPETALYLGFAGVVVAGAFQALAGRLRLGHVVSFMPLPVLVGFVNASALLVFLSSLPLVLGALGETVGGLIASGFADASAWASAVGGVTVAAIFLLEGRVRLVPAALLGLAVGTGVYYAGVLQFGLPAGPEVGHIDLLALVREPYLLAAGIDWRIVLEEADIPLLAGLSIGLLTSFDTVLSSSALDMQTDDETDANRDLTSHGLANAAMGVLGFLPGSGTLARSTASVKAGAATRLANVGTGVVFALMLIVLSPLVAALPLWATAGMLVATAVQAVDRSTVDKIKGIAFGTVPYPRVLAGDLLVTLVVVVTAAVLDLIAAVGVGIVLAIALFVLGMGRDPVRRAFTAERVRSNVQRPLAQLEVLEREGHRIAVIEIQGALFFGACARLLAQAKEMLARKAQYLIVDCRHLSSIDSTGAATLRTLAVMCAEAGGRLLISRVEPERRLRRDAATAAESDGGSRRRSKASPRWIWLVMEANGVIDALGERNFFDDADTALAACEERVLRQLGRAAGPAGRGVIASSALFDGLGRDAGAVVGRHARRRRFGAGEAVFRQGDPGAEAYLLVRGRMDVTIDIPGSSRKRRVSVLTEGALFGEMGVIDGAPRSATVTAVESCVCFALGADDLAALAEARPDIALVLMRNVCGQFADRLRIANNMISELEQ